MAREYDEYMQEIARQRAGLMDKLASDTHTIKEGHVVKDRNPKGERLTMQLGSSQISNGQKELEILENILLGKAS